MKMEQRGSLRFGMLSLLVLSLWFPLQGAVSGNEESAPAGTALVATPLLQVPPINAEALRLRDKRAKSGRRSKDLQFAEPFEANARHVDCGQWDVLENGLVRWTLLVHAPGATDVNIGFTDVVLPEGCSLRIMTADEGFSVGPYSQADMTANRQLWTPVLPGDFIMIEATMPAQARSGFALTVSRVNSGYLDLMNWLDNAAKGARKAQGLCNIDVVCPETAGWANPIRSVGRYTINGTGLCTGTLLMNQRADFRPFFLTANHCISASGDAASVVVYWNYQSPTCGNLSGGSLAQYQSGASLRATHEATDFTLLELSTNPGASFNVHYAGWDRSNTASAGAVGIHHPDGREKAWSKETHTLSSTDAYYETVNASAGYWRVLHWELGTTEPGSSGSGLWSLAGKRVVGQLLGGDSACNGVDSNFQSDWYGKLYTSWTGGGTAATRLRDWLDPDNTGLTGMDGLNPSSSSITIWPASRIHTTSAAASGQKIAVTSTVPWTATRSANWITITGGASGSGNGTVTYNISTNSGLVRYGYITVTGGGVSRRFHINQNTAKVIVANDFDGDGKSDLGYYRPTGGLWSFRLSGGGTRTNEFGYVGTIPITGDFDGDEITDFGCYDAATGKWYIMPSKSPFRQASFGYQGTIPIVGDFDGDGKADFGCYDPSGIPGHAAPGSWYIMQSSRGFRTASFGYPGTVPIVGDFDGDGIADFGCYDAKGIPGHAAPGSWYIMPSSRPFRTATFGYVGTVPVVGDFDGDRKADIGCYDAAGIPGLNVPPGSWYIMPSSRPFRTATFGYAGTEPVVGDYDGDKKADFGCYDAKGIPGQVTPGTWFIMQSGGQFRRQAWGGNGMIPLGK